MHHQQIMKLMPIIAQKQLNFYYSKTYRKLYKTTGSHNNVEQGQCSGAIDLISTCGYLPPTDMRRMVNKTDHWTENLCIHLF